jgi:predicted lactoylglutathione lyase
MPRKTRQNKHRIECGGAAVKILRTVGDEEAFHFYTAIGQPTGKKAISLQDFLEKMKIIKLESLVFHLQRKDFQNWLEKTIGDSELARRISRIRVSSNDRVRMKIGVAIESRLEDLKEETSMFMPVDEKFIVASAS